MVLKVFILSFVGVLKDRKKLLFGFEKIKNAVIINVIFFFISHH